MFHRTKLNELYLMTENGQWLGLCTLDEPSFTIKGFAHQYVLVYLMMLFPKETRWDHDHCSHRWSIINATRNVYFSTSTVDFFPFKRTSISTLPPATFSGCGLCVSVIFPVFHSPGVSEDYCFATINDARSRETKVLLHPMPSNTTREEAYWEFFPISNSCLLTDPKFWGLHRTLSLKYGRQ